MCVLAQYSALFYFVIAARCLFLLSYVRPNTAVASWIVCYSAYYFINYILPNINLVICNILFVQELQYNNFSHLNIIIISLLPSYAMYIVQ